MYAQAHTDCDRNNQYMYMVQTIGMKYEPQNEYRWWRPQLEWILQCNLTIQK